MRWLERTLCEQADLVPLDADSTASVQNLHTKDAVIRGGRYYKADDLLAMRRGAAAQNGGRLKQTRSRRRE